MAITAHNGVMRRFWAMSISLCLLGAACGEESGEQTEIEMGQAFVEDLSLRRTTMKDSIVDPENYYSSLRLENYGLKRGWDALPVYNPRVTPVTQDDLGTFDSLGTRPNSNDSITAPAVRWDHDSLMRAGEWAFRYYPLDVDGRLHAAVTSRDAADEMGMWVDSTGELGLVSVQVGDGREQLAWTCATCHSALNDRGELVHLRTNEKLDAGKIFRTAEGDDAPYAYDWGPGQFDASRDDVDNPVAISDLQSIRYQRFLHHTATLRNNLLALAVRVETSFITTEATYYNASRRPPRELAFALAYWMWNSSPEEVEPIERGRDLFEANCSLCHNADGTVQDPVAPALVGTDPTAAEGPARGTGRYRIPSLAGVGKRSVLLHDASVYSVRELISPDRPEHIVGHTFGHHLSDEQREDLLAFVLSL